MTDSNGRCLTNLEEGAKLCKESAERLLQDAKLLFDNCRFQSSYILSQLSLEEQAKAFRLFDKHSRGKSISKSEWMDFAYCHEEKVRYIQTVIDAFDAYVVKRQTGIDFWQVLKKMYQGQGEKSLESYQRKVSRMLTKFRRARLYVDYDFEKDKWSETNHKDGVVSLRSMHTAQRMLNFLILKMERREGKK